MNYREQFDKDGYIVIDNLIEMSYQEKIKEYLLDVNFPWYYQHDASFGVRDTEQSKFPIFSHIFRTDRVLLSNQYELFEQIAMIATDSIEYNCVDVDTCRAYLQLPLSETFRRKDLDYLHIDTTDNHLVVLYYVNDSDGDTILTSEIYDGKYRDYYMKADDGNIITRVTPKQGRILMFNGNHYHTTTQCKDNIRCVVNYNII